MSAVIAQWIKYLPLCETTVWNVANCIVLYIQYQVSSTVISHYKHCMSMFQAYISSLCIGFTVSKAWYQFQLHFHINLPNIPDNGHSVFIFKSCILLPEPQTLLCLNVCNVLNSCTLASGTEICRRLVSFKVFLLQYLFIEMHCVTQQ